MRKSIPREIIADHLPEAVQFLRKIAKERNYDAVIDRSPIFLLSAGWRSGSTLLQRLVCSNKSVLVWGEPYGDRIPVPRLSSTIAEFSPGDPTIKYAIENFSGEMSEEWIANLNPGPKVLRRAHLAYFENLFARQAQENGYNHWGIKSVRLSAFHAHYLQWLYPQAKFVFLVRHPLSAYHSYKRKKWFSVRPYFQVNNVYKFMSFWNYLAKSFITEQVRLNSILIRFEDLTGNDQTVKKLSEFLDIDIQTEVLKNKVGSRDKKKLRISLIDKMVCRRIAAGVYQRLGYHHHP